MRPAAEARVRAGHPWVFSESIRGINRPGEAGELAVIFDRNDRFLAIGLYDPDSPIRVRILHSGKPATIDAHWWKARLEQAAAKRAGIFDSQTNAGRWINGESDSFPALVLDRYDRTLVLKLYSAIWFPRLDEMVHLITDHFAPERVVLRLSRNIIPAAVKAGRADGQTILGPVPPGPVTFLESGLLFEADVLHGQKTGFFLDQRENRRRVEKLAGGRNVLNAFSFSGGFSVYAARGGARSVTDVDISPHALESAGRNFRLNCRSTGSCEHRLVQADVFEWLQHAPAARYDLLVLDPPSLAKREAERFGALSAYAALAQSGARLAKKGGILVCCSCSGHVSAGEFFGTVQSALRKAGRPFRVMETALEPPDHHAAFAEAAYLKAIYLQLD